MFSYGASRDARVLEGLEKWRYMTTMQVAEMYFYNIKNEQQRHNKARERLKKLFDKGLCYRMRIPGEHYIYSLQNKGYNHKVAHYLAIIDVWLQLTKIKPSGTLLYSQIEVKNDDLVTDLVIHAKNNFRNEEKTYYIEVELNSSGDIREKLDKYEALFWSITKEKMQGNSLGIVYGNKRLAPSNISYDSNLDIKLYDINNLAAEWQW